MGLRVKTNIESIQAQRRLSKNRELLGESLEKLASGSRITSQLMTQQVWRSRKDFERKSEVYRLPSEMRTMVFPIFRLPKVV